MIYLFEIPTAKRIEDIIMMLTALGYTPIYDIINKPRAKSGISK